MTHEYFMPATTLGKLLKSRGLKELICNSRLCNDPIEVDQRVVSTGWDGCRKIWHKKCYYETLY